MVRISAATFLAFVALSSASSWGAADGESLAARADAPASNPEDLKQLDTLIDAVATLSDMLQQLKQGASDSGDKQGETPKEEPKDELKEEPKDELKEEPKEEAGAA